MSLEFNLEALSLWLGAAWPVLVIGATFSILVPARQWILEQAVRLFIRREQSDLNEFKSKYQSLRSTHRFQPREWVPDEDNNTDEMAVWKSLVRDTPQNNSTPQPQTAIHGPANCSGCGAVLHWSTEYSQICEYCNTQNFACPF
jgi:hypothetical protein